MSKIFAHAWNLILGEKYELLRHMLLYFGSYKKAWQNFEKENYHSLNLPPETFTYLQELKRKINPEEAFFKLSSQNIFCLTLYDKEYPPLLRHIPQPPLILYYQGSLECLSKTCLAIVGTRKSTNYGNNCTNKIVKKLVEHDITIVSGFARGIDSLAHNYAIKYGGKTAAVFAHGLNQLYPASNRYLAEKIIASGGVLLTEFPPQTPSHKFYFLRRNRIISGLSQATCIIECPNKSGAMNTAQHAFEQNRNVYVVPGDIYRPNSQGPLQLIQKEKAFPIEDAENILLDLGLPIKKMTALSKQFSSDELQIYQILDPTKALSLQEIHDQSRIPLNRLNSVLFNLELAGHIEKNAQGYLKILT